MRKLLAVLAGLALATSVAAVVQNVTSASAAVCSADWQTGNTLSSSSDFYDCFDMGYSGISPFFHGDSPSFHGDHDLSCGGATTDRTVTHHPIGNGRDEDFSELFWYCAPGNDPTKGHVMTGVDTLGYNMAWFSPKDTFTAISKVCWSINETTMSSRKWTQVVFVGAADAVRYPAGTVTSDGQSVARGTGGFDLGYTAPDFRQTAPNTGIFPQGGTLAGARINMGIVDWFQNQDTFTALGVGWPGTLPQFNPGGQPIVDKAARYKHCLENLPGGQMRFTYDSPWGQRTQTFTGQIPQDARRVVFQDDNYDPAKGDNYSSTVLTWHWDDIQVFGTPSSGPLPTTTTTQGSTTTLSTTTTSSTLPPTTTTSSTTTTVPDVCAVFPDQGQHDWCETVEARLG